MVASVVCMYIDFYISAMSAWTLTAQGYLGLRRTCKAPNNKGIIHSYTRMGAQNEYRVAVLISSITVTRQNPTDRRKLQRCWIRPDGAQTLGDRRVETLSWRDCMHHSAERVFGLLEESSGVDIAGMGGSVSSTGLVLRVWCVAVWMSAVTIQVLRRGAPDACCQAVAGILHGLL
jgi:hypothetical protein